MTLSAAQSALDHAWHLVRKGEVVDARFWASEAANLDPGLEEAWLILAALSDPNQSFEYLRKALDINPRSRRANRGVQWAEDLTGRSFAEFTSSLHEFFHGFEQPIAGQVYQSADFLTEKVSNEAREPEERTETPQFDLKAALLSDSMEPPQEMLIRRRPRRPRPTEPLNPWSVLLPYTVSFVIFLFLFTLYLLSGLPYIRVESARPQTSTDELVSQILTSIPRATATLKPTITLSPTRTPTKIPTITQTFTPQPTSTPIPPTPIPTDDGIDTAISIKFGDISADTLEDGRWIDVDLAQQKVRAYARDILIKEFVVSTGTASHPTVKGNFHIYIKNRYADMRGPGYYLPNVPYTMYFHQSYGLHGTYWHHNFGTPMSHGCVNLKTEDAGWLFNWASIGTLVHVH